MSNPINLRGEAASLMHDLLSGGDTVQLIGRINKLGPGVARKVYRILGDQATGMGVILEQLDPQTPPKLRMLQPKSTEKPLEKSSGQVNSSPQETAKLLYAVRPPLQTTVDTSTEYSVISYGGSISPNKVSNFWSKASGYRERIEIMVIFD